MRSRFARIAALSLAGLALALVATAARSAPMAGPKLLSAYGTPTIDGVIAPGEWSAAAKVDFQLKLPPGASGGSTPSSLLVMNDATNLYVGYQISATLPGWSGVSLNFAGDGSAAPSEGDQALVVNSWNGSFREYYDEYYTSKPPCPAAATACLGIEDFRTGGTTDGVVGATSDGQASFIELALPLNDSDDAHDFNLSAGDLIAITDTSVVNVCDGTVCTRTPVTDTPLQIVIAPFGVPVVSGFTPDRGATGAAVMIKGEHFAGATAVTFAGKPAEFEVTSGGREIDATVPRGARTGPIAVATPGGTATSSLPFVVPGAKPVIGPPATIPKKLVAGKPASVAFKVTRSDTGAKLTSGTMVCDPSVGGRVIAHREAFRNGTASLRFTIPQAARGRQLTVRVTITSGGRTASRTSTFRVS